MSNDSRTFEQNMQRLEQIVRALERGDAPLEESLKLFQEGTELVSSCQKLLEEAQLRVTQIMTNPDGTPAEEVFMDEGSI
ncbi:MAG: exodeoxyribonuclease VII small subunit [Oscillospiraceae bacterium]|nr:exodeoxyribonuclease VII small subunit [Oscillospiraceae bacterium]